MTDVSSRIEEVTAEECIAPVLKDLQTKTSTLQAFGAWRAEEPTLNGAPNEVVPALLTTADLLPMLGLWSHQGRFSHLRSAFQANASLIL